MDATRGRCHHGCFKLRDLTLHRKWLAARSGRPVPQHTQYGHAEGINTIHKSRRLSANERLV
ncbi:MAG TPA: hypothetical protein VIQ74_07910, partial [Gemmatimonadaceae bacterium]